MSISKQFVALSGAVLLAMTACGPRTAPQNSLSPRLNNTRFQNATANATAAPSSGKKWTIAIHLAADNNLYRAGLDDINEMEAGLAQNPEAAKMLDIIVLFDGLPRGDSKIYRITPDKNGYDKTIISEEIDDKGAVIPTSKEIDSGSAEVMNKFMDFVTRNFNAKHNGFVIWNHGSGIYENNRDGLRAVGASSLFDITGLQRTGGRSTPSRSFASDDQSGNHMKLSDLNPALDIARKNLGKRMDFLDFDTCLMQYVETAYQVKGQTGILIASEELEPGDGQDYEAYLGALAKNPDMNPIQLASIIVDTYGVSYRPGGSQRGRDITLSAIDVDKLNAHFVPAINQLGQELKANLTESKAAISEVRNQTQTFYNRDSIDLGDFLKKLNLPGRQGRLAAASAQVQQAMNSMVIRETHYGRGVEGATGVQIYMPRSTMSYNRKYDDPAQIRFAETRAWGDFLRAFTAK